MTHKAIKQRVIPRRRSKPREYTGLVTGEKRDNYWFWYNWHSYRSSRRAHEVAKQLAGLEEREFIQPDLFDDPLEHLGLEWMLKGGWKT